MKVGLELRDAGEGIQRCGRRAKETVYACARAEWERGPEDG